MNNGEAVSPIRRWWQKLPVSWQRGLSFLGLAVVGTIVGDSVFELVTGQFVDWGFGAWVWRIVLLLVAGAAAVVGVDDILNVLRVFQGHSKTGLDVPPATGLEPKPALIVMASASMNPSVGPHWTAVRQFATAPDTRLAHVFIIHSAHERSKTSAEALATHIQTPSAEMPIDVSVQLLETNFDDPVEITATANAAITLAAARVNALSDVVLDATGGTAMASVGAAMAKLQNSEVVFSYIPNKPDGGFGEELKEVNIALTSQSSHGDQS